MRKLLLLFAAIAAHAETIQAVIVEAHDGDTFTALHGERELKLRLALADTPEMQAAWSRQPGAIESRDAAIAFLGGSLPALADVEIIKLDRYKRPLVRIRRGGRDLTEHLLASGWAWFYRDDSLRQADARSLYDAWSVAVWSRRGLWARKAKAHPVEPFLWRRGVEFTR